MRRGNCTSMGNENVRWGKEGKLIASLYSWLMFSSSLTSISLFQPRSVAVFVVRALALAGAVVDVSGVVYAGLARTFVVAGVTTEA